jgi:NAD(P)-dependent dehydrogenase (short-subunit alcohol dehydrogenase family)
MAVDLAKDGIRVVGVAPGSVDTPLTRAEIRRRGVTIEEAGFSRDPRALGHVADPADIAEVVAFLASEQAAIVTGQTLIADGGLLTRFAGS